MSRQDRITIAPRVQGGRPVIRGTRVPVEVLTGAVAAGDTVEQVAEDYAVTVADVQAALAYATDLVASEQVLPLPQGKRAALAVPRRREPAGRRRRSASR